MIKSAMSNGDGGSVTPAGVTNAFAGIHNHPDSSPPSAGDLYSLMKTYKANNTYTTKYVTLPNGANYAIVVTDPSALTKFLLNYPSVQIPGYPPDFSRSSI